MISGSIIYHMKIKPNKPIYAITNKNKIVRLKHKSELSADTIYHTQEGWYGWEHTLTGRFEPPALVGG